MELEPAEQVAETAFIVSCYKNANIREAVTDRLDRLGYKRRANTIEDVQFSTETGEYGNYKHSENPKAITVDEFFKFLDMFIKPDRIKLTCLRVGERFTEFLEGDSIEWVITDHTESGNILAVNPKNWKTRFFNRDKIVQRVVPE